MAIQQIEVKKHFMPRPINSQCTLSTDEALTVITNTRTQMNKKETIIFRLERSEDTKKPMFDKETQRKHSDKRVELSLKYLDRTL